MKKYFTIISTILFMTMAAQETKVLTLEEAINMGLAASKQLTIDQAKQQGAKAKYDQMRFANIPNLSINATYLYNSPNIDEIVYGVNPAGEPMYISMTLHNQNQNKLSLSQTIFNGLRLFNNTKATKKLYEASTIDIEKDKIELKNQIANNYFNHLKLIESKKILLENIKIYEARKREVENMQSAGIVLKNDVLKVDLAILNLQQNINEVANAIAISNYNLCILLGINENSQLELTTLLPENNIENKSSWVEKSIQNRNDIKALDKRLEAGKYAVKASKSGYYPTISGAGNFYYSNPNNRVFAVTEANRKKYYYTWDIGFGLNWNLTNLFTTSFVTKEAKANQKIMEVQQAQLKDAIKVEVNSAFSSYELALQKIDLAKEMLTKAKEDQRITKNQYDNGIKKITDMLDADNAVTTAAINLTNAKIDAQIAFIKLTKSAGI